MLGKFALIALVCVSVAQVRGDDVDDAIESGVKRISQMYQNGKDRYIEVVKDGDAGSRDIARWSKVFVQRERRAQESSRQAIRNVAEVVEEKARENNQPESVFQCITRIENRANNVIGVIVNKFEIDIDYLEDSERANIEADLRTTFMTGKEFTGILEKDVEDMKKCLSTECVNSVVDRFIQYITFYYDTMNRLDRQTATVFGKFNREATNSYSTSSQEIARVQSEALKGIRSCF